MMRLASLLRLLLIVALPLLFLSAGRAQQIHLEARSEGRAVMVHATVELAVDPSTIWSVISDYDHLADFIPDMRTSRVLERDGGELLILQTGDFGILFFRQTIEVKLAVVETPPHRIEARAVGGNLGELNGRYELLQLADRQVRLSYTGRLVPDFPVPDFIGRIVVRSMLTKQFGAMVKEILRRDGMLRNIGR